jgi:hypothetical protein
MGKELTKVTIILDDELNRKVRKYIVDTYPDSQYGKLKDVIEEALREFLGRHVKAEG